MILLILAGESIFISPFLVARVFRPTILTVFEINNTQLGLAYSVYGIVAMICYLFGGPLADKYPVGKLMGSSLILTSLGAFYMATIPSYEGLVLLYAFWGMSTILFFWSALIKATRLWGGQEFSGRAFGFLDGGRGLSAAIISSVAVGIFSNYIPQQGEALTKEQVYAPMQTVILSVGIVTLVIGFLILFILKLEHIDGSKHEGITKGDILKVARIPTVYLQALIIICAYVGYKTSDDFSLYAFDVLGYNDSEAARIGSLSFWMRPIAAIGAGLLADRYRSTNMTMICFLLMITGGILFVTIGSTTIMFFIALVSTSLGIYGLRGLYYAIMNEGHIPIQFTGTAVGLMAVIGYTPEIFMGPIMGVMLDSYPGITGHKLVMSLLILFGLIGLLSTYGYKQVSEKMESNLVVE